MQRCFRHNHSAQLTHSLAVKRTPCPNRYSTDDSVWTEPWLRFTALSVQTAVVAFQSTDTNGRNCLHLLRPQCEIVQLQSTIVNNNRGTMKALENQLAREQERCSQRELEVRQRKISWKASSLCQSRENDSLALGVGRAMWRTLQKERRDSVCRTFGSKVSSLSYLCAP